MDFNTDALKSSLFVGEIDVAHSQDSKNDEKCVNFISEMSENNVCNLLRDEKALYSSFLMGLQPRALCPMKRGVYRYMYSIHKF